MVELLTVGGCKYIISIIINKLGKEYCLNTLYKRDPELVYYDIDKREIFSNKALKNILLYLLYCVPGLSDILLLLQGGASLVNCFVVKNNIDEIAIKAKHRGISPMVKKTRMDYARCFYDSKTIVDSLVLEGASDREINKVLTDARKEIGSSYEDEDLYDRVRNNITNMKKIKRYSRKVENPTKLYKDTKDREITDMFISDDDLEKLVVHMNLMYSNGEFETSKTYRLKK